MKKRLNIVVMITLLFCFSIGSVSIPSAEGAYTNLSQPVYQVTVDYGVMIPTRDEIRLASNIWRPNAEGKFPAILQYSPYPKSGAAVPTFFAQRGYVVIQAEKRGCGNSEGYTVDYFEPKEWTDGYDLVEWIVKQPWCNGKVAMTGGSYPAIMATRTATLQHPNLVTLAFASDYANFYGDAFFPGGWRSGNIWGFRHLQNILRTMLKGPIYDDPATGGVMLDLDLYNYQITHNNWKTHTKGFWENTEYNEFWMQKDLRSKYDKFNLPILEIGPYFDDNRLNDEIYQDYLVLKNKNIPVKLILGPWAHAGSQGPQRVNTSYYYLAWYDYWLKGIDTGIMEEPRITMFVMRENKWRYEEDWPIKRTKFTKYYLTPKGNLTTNPGEANAEISKTKKDSLQYTYKPWVGLTAGSYGGGPTMQPTLGYDEFRIQMDQRRDEIDSLTFTTEELEQDTEVTGMAEIEFYASSTSNDTDFCVKLCDVLPNGKSELVVRGWQNSSYRESNVNPRYPEDWKFVQPTKITPGEVYKYKFTIQNTSYVFKKGHRIRVTIASGDWPTMWPNPNLAQNTIYFSNVDGKKHSHRGKEQFANILLPIVPPQYPALPEPEIVTVPDVYRPETLDCWIEEHLGPNPDGTTNSIAYSCEAITTSITSLGNTWQDQQWSFVLPKGTPSDHSIPFVDTRRLTLSDGKTMERTMSATVDKNGPRVNLKVKYPDGSISEY